MPYQGFWGLCALTLILLGHSVYCMVTTTKGKKLQPLGKKSKAVLGVLLLLCGAALGAGVVLMLCAADEAVVHVMGLALLLAAFALNSQVRRCLPELIKNEEEETNNE